jgi:hypothetical protein
MTVAERRCLGARAEGLRRVRCPGSSTWRALRVSARRRACSLAFDPSRKFALAWPHTVGVFVVAGRHVDSTFLALRRPATRVN